MDDLGLDDMVAGVNKIKDNAKKDKNAQVQLMKKIRANHSSVEKVVLRDDPLAKTAETIFSALSKNDYIRSINFNKVKITNKALESLAKALRTNTVLETLIIHGPTPSDGMLEVIKALEQDNTTLTTLTLQSGNGKYWDSLVEKAFKDRLCCNTSLLKVNIGPIRSTDVRNALQQLPKTNATQKRETGGVSDDAWERLMAEDDGGDDSYEYVYDPDFGKESDVKEDPGRLV